MLFQIDGTKTRLAGSMHVLPKGQPIPDWVESNYHWSNSLYLEHDEQAVIPKLFLPADQTSQQFFSPDTWVNLTAAWPAHLGPLTRWKLWMIPPLLALSTVPTDAGVEPRLIQLARADNRPIGYLEAESEFVSFAESIPNSICIAGIERILEDPSFARHQTETMYEAWKQGNVERVTELFASTQLMRFPIVKKALIDDRNSLWLGRITTLLTLPDPTLIVVGGGHLGGENGLLQLLTRAGHSLSQLA